MTARYELTVEEVNKIVADELNRRGLKFSNLTPRIDKARWYDLNDEFAGYTFDVDISIKELAKIVNFENSKHLDTKA